jgi:hypothetical protein
MGSIPNLTELAHIFCSKTAILPARAADLHRLAGACDANFLRGANGGRLNLAPQWPNAAVLHPDPGA